MDWAGACDSSGGGGGGGAAASACRKALDYIVAVRSVAGWQE